MSSIMKELKTEIARLARKEINKELAPVKRVTAAQRGLIADLRRQLAALQKEIGGLRRAVPTVEVPVAAPSADAESAGRFWITGKGVRTLRKRLGLTQAEFAKLAGVSGQTVVNWEATEGKIALRRKDTPAKLKEIRSLNKRAVRKIFEKAAKA
jgi:DNA-binding XRE family transcriptional regulator